MIGSTNNAREAMNEEEIRQAVKMDVPSDAIDVTKEEDTTTIELFYHEPESRVKPMRNPFGRGIILAIEEPNGEKLMSRVMDDIQLSSSPDDWTIEDKGNFYVVTLTYEDGRTW